MVAFNQTPKSWSLCSCTKTKSPQKFIFETFWGPFAHEWARQQVDHLCVYDELNLIGAEHRKHRHIMPYCMWAFLRAVYFEVSKIWLALYLELKF